MRVLAFVPNGDDTAYWRALSDEWHGAGAVRGFVNVERGIQVTGAQLHELWACPGDWCAAPYPYLDRERQFGLGAVKFSAPLIERHPGLWEAVAFEGQRWRLNDPLHPPRHWCRLDALSYQVLRANGEVRCEDHTPVGKLGQPSKTSGHGCYSVP